MTATPAGRSDGALLERVPESRRPYLGGRRQPKSQAHSAADQDGKQCDSNIYRGMNGAGKSKRPGCHQGAYTVVRQNESAGTAERDQYRAFRQKLTQQSSPAGP